ncbi:peptidoglycan recognition protein family protein [Pseudonocardia bannensis]|uniref:N-acetylmuramoyl-L-alanine amidase n=1 Tax=Pseudonocardia bannensis TaxID=630973 RepID=A0A848DFQ8_9PSEU|nr:N-acetylmuramoyl-L-alanine amidase [Pseudonocardia bannensis]NMH91371.1 N-acetylmuramoyl-L-alanine amidase [Pseudonocardia bannensis]
MSRRDVLLGGLALAGGGILAGGLESDQAWAAASPPIIDCAGWGARPNSRVVPIWNQRPVKILVHHTATPNVADFSRGAADRLARGIQNFHMDRRGWLDTGQHFTISRGGFVLEGRHRSLEVLRIGKRQVEGAHCTGQNVVAVGIENEGTYTAADPPAELWNRLREMCAYICSQYAIRPTEIFGHRDFKDTACPGDRLYGMLPRLRTEVAGALGRRIESRSAIKASWPLLRVADRGPTVLAAQYLLRDAGMAEVVPDGRFGRPMADAVRSYQAANGFEEVNGMIGGESWPALARPVRRGEGGDAERAVETLAGRRGAESLPDVITAPVWQNLLGTGGAP